MSGSRAIRDDRLSAPREHLGVLIEPPLPLAGRVRSEKQAARGRVLDHDIGGLRIALAAQLGLDRSGPFRSVGPPSPTTDSASGSEARRYGSTATAPKDDSSFDGPIIVSGHQAEFFHAGIFAKTIAGDLLADALRGQSLFLLADTDTPKSTHVSVATRRADAVERESVPIPGIDSRLPVEFQPRVDGRQWRAFFERIAQIASADDVSLISAFAAGAVGATETPIGIAEIVTRGQTAVERELGLPPARVVRMSELCETLSFRAFLAHWLLEAPRLAEAYNGAQTAYRERHGVRSTQRPVPPLQIGERIECPFWAYRAGETRRRLMVAVRHDALELFADDTPIGTEPHHHFRGLDYHGQPWELAQRGWRIRPRALMLSAFARLFLADLFLHGIGGARYDEITEDFLRRGFGVNLPPIACVTATIYPRIAGIEAGSSPTVTTETLRDLQYNPHRVLRSAPPEAVARRSELAAESERLRRGPQRADHRRRREVYQAIRAANRELRSAAGAEVARLEGEWSAADERRRREAVLLNREFFFALHSRPTLAQLVERVRMALQSNI